MSLAYRSSAISHSSVHRASGESFIGSTNGKSMTMALGVWHRFRCQFFAILVPLLATPALGQNSLVKNVELCDGIGGSPVDLQIEACSALIKSGAVKPHGLAVAHNNRGNAHIKKGNYDSAIQDFEESLKINPSYAKALNNRGAAYQKKGEYDRSIADFDQAIKLDPSYASALANRAESYLYKSEYERAARDYDEVYRLQPTWAVARNGRCWAHAIIGNLQLALTDCNEALRLEPNIAATFDSRGLVYLKMGRWDAAIADYDAALRVDPKQVGSLYGRGVAKLKKGDPNGKVDIASALAMDANIPRDFARYGVD